MSRLHMTDRKAIIALALGLPALLLSLLGILLWALVVKRIDQREFYPCLRVHAPVLTTYVGSILGFAFGPQTKPKSKLRP